MCVRTQRSLEEAFHVFERNLTILRRSLLICGRSLPVCGGDMPQTHFGRVFRFAAVPYILWLIWTFRLQESRSQGPRSTNSNSQFLYKFYVHCLACSLFLTNCKFLFCTVYELTCLKFSTSKLYMSRNWGPDTRRLSTATESIRQTYLTTLHSSGSQHLLGASSKCSWQNYQFERTIQEKWRRYLQSGGLWWTRKPNNTSPNFYWKNYTVLRVILCVSLFVMCEG